jgi:hypothetical protein
MLVLGSETRKTEVRFTGGPGIFIFATVSRLVLGLTLRPNQWLMDALFAGIRIIAA